MVVVSNVSDTIPLKNVSTEQFIHGVRVRTHHALTCGDPNGVDAARAAARCRTTLLVGGAVTVPLASAVTQLFRV